MLQTYCRCFNRNTAEHLVILILFLLIIIIIIIIIHIYQEVEANAQVYSPSGPVHLNGILAERGQFDLMSA